MGGLKDEGEVDGPDEVGNGVEGHHAEESDAEEGHWEDVVLEGIYGLEIMLEWFLSSMFAETYSDYYEPKVLGHLRWVDLDVLVLVVIEDVLPLRDLSG